MKRVKWRWIDGQIEGNLLLCVCVKIVEIQLYQESFEILWNHLIGFWQCQQFGDFVVKRLEHKYHLVLLFAQMVIILLVFGILLRRIRERRHHIAVSHIAERGQLLLPFTFDVIQLLEQLLIHIAELVDLQQDILEGLEQRLFVVGVEEAFGDHLVHVVGVRLHQSIHVLAVVCVLLEGLPRSVQNIEHKVRLEDLQQLVHGIANQRATVLDIVDVGEHGDGVAASHLMHPRLVQHRFGKLDLDQKHEDLVVFVQHTLVEHDVERQIHVVVQRKHIPSNLARRTR
mmetsp:Transcript_19460/g.30911  ORF Transcript_19460/g.30911 Transcript_19460/m.30911 type:complete len:285 (+) Transcript_19460:307-1161(+)